MMVNARTKISVEVASLPSNMNRKILLIPVKEIMERNFVIINGYLLSTRNKTFRCFSNRSLTRR